MLMAIKNKYTWIAKSFLTDKKVLEVAQITVDLLQLPPLRKPVTSTGAMDPPVDFTGFCPTGIHIC